jgi:hypothetical protein
MTAFNFILISCILFSVIFSGVSVFSIGVSIFPFIILISHFFLINKYKLIDRNIVVTINIFALFVLVLMISSVINDGDFILDLRYVVSLFLSYIYSVSIYLYLRQDKNNIKSFVYLMQAVTICLVVIYGYYSIKFGTVFWVRMDDLLLVNGLDLDSVYMNSSIFINSNIIARVSLLTWSFFLLYGYLYRKNTSLFTIALVILIVFTESKANILSVSVIYAYMFMVKQKKNLHMKLIFISFISVLLVSLALSGAEWERLSKLQESLKYLNITDSDPYSIPFPRVKNLVASIQISLDNPWLGASKSVSGNVLIDYGSYKEKMIDGSKEIIVIPPHGVIINFLVYGGFISILLLFLFYKKLYQFAQCNRSVHIITVFIIMTFLSGLGANILAMSHYWVFFGIIIYWIKTENNYENHTCTP